MEGVGPTAPKIIDNKLYGRGGADDGYALPGAALAVKTLQTLGIPHGRILIIAENEEESGSASLMGYVDKLRERIGEPELVICLDSGAGNYEQLWVTSSLRGAIMMDLDVSVLTVGQHSGEASGIVPSSFRILRLLLDRLEDAKTGNILVPELSVEISQQILEQAKEAAQVLGANVYEFPWAPHVSPVTNDPVEAVLNRTYRPTLSITGATGLPEMATAGNVIRPNTGVRLSIRTPPGVNAKQVANTVKDLIAADPPYNAKVDLSVKMTAEGWAPAPMENWLSGICNEASMKYFGKQVVFYGEGGSIPFIAMLGEMFPRAQFIVTGVLGPLNNAHSANEMLNIAYLKPFLCCVSHILAGHAGRSS